MQEEMEKAKLEF